MINRLFVLPTVETLDLLQAMFSGGPIEINWEHLCVELGSSLDPIKPYSPETTYRAIPGSLNSWYEIATGRSFLLLPLYPSPEMVQRNAEIGDAWGRVFIPFMEITDDQGNRRRVRKAFINSVATGLVDTSPILSFHNETVVTSTITVPPHNEFYADQMWRGPVTNQVFLDKLNSSR